MSSGAVPGVAGEAVRRALRRRGHDVGGRFLAATLAGTVGLALGILTLLLVTTAIEAAPVLQSRGVGFLRSGTSSLASRAGVWQGLSGSLILIGLVAVIALPLGIGAAIYLQEYARPTRINRLLVANVRNLAGVPSIVYGILGLVIFVQALRPITGPGSYGRSYLSGGLTLAVLVMPIVILISMEALRAVPSSIREAAYGVGATRWEVVRSHVIPSAAPGLFTGVILSLARAFGETAPLLLVGAVTSYLNTPSGRAPVEVLQGPYTSLPTLIFAWSRQPGEEWRADTAAAILVLLLAILLVNSVAIVLRNHYDRSW